MLLWLADKAMHWLLSPRVSRPIEKSAEFEMDAGGDYEQFHVARKRPDAPVWRLSAQRASRKTGRGFRRSRIPPRRAHDTLQPQGESIIVGYYTSAEVLLRKLPRPAQSELRR